MQGTIFEAGVEKKPREYPCRADCQDFTHIMRFGGRGLSGLVVVITREKEREKLKKDSLVYWYIGIGTFLIDLGYP
jgi:hypothetical protein